MREERSLKSKAYEDENKKYLRGRWDKAQDPGTLEVLSMTTFDLIDKGFSSQLLLD